MRFALKTLAGTGGAQVIYVPLYHVLYRPTGQPAVAAKEALKKSGSGMLCHCFDFTKQFFKKKLRGGW